MTIVESKDVVRREVVFSAHDAGESNSLLGALGRGWRLKVSRDKPQSSDIVELASRRCLVGSGPSCHVRVDEPGVAPIECLIIRGAQNNVVRWLAASHELAGNELFEDEVLYAGDPLQVGPVELELLVDELMSEQPPPNEETHEDRLAEYLLRLERLESQLVELQQASESTASLSDALSPSNGTLNGEVAATISDLAAQLAALQSRSASDRDLWAGERTELESLLQSRLREFDFWQEEVQRLRDELVAVRSDFNNRLANEDASERLAEVSQQLAERTAGFEQQQTSWERDRSEFQSQLQQNIERIEQFETQFAQQNERQAASEAVRQAAETRANRLQESVEELSKRLAEQQQDYEKVRAAWEADRASLESELADTKQRLAQSVAAESAGREFPETRDRERAESNPMDRLLAGSSPADDCADEPEGPLRDFLALRPSFRDDAESEDPDDTDSDSGYGRAADAASNYSERAFSDLRSETYLDDAPADEETLENPLLAATGIGAYGHPFGSTEPAIDEDEEDAFEIASSAPPVSTADVLARLGHSGAWNDDEIVVDGSDDEPGSDASNLPNDVFSRFAPSATAEPRDEPSQCRPSSETSFAPSAPAAANDSEDDDESIEAYMARLMSRVRGTNEADEPPSHVQPISEGTPFTEYTEVAEAPQPDREPETEKFDPEEYKPRSQAPELADRMSAMRSLANDSARTAIASHAKRNWSSVMKLKMLVSMFAFVSVVASIIFFWGNPLLMGLGSLVGVGVLVYWAHTAITYRKLLLDSLMLEPEGGGWDNTTSGDAA